MEISHERHHNKINGIYYTPSSLAEFLIEPLITQKNISIFDPAYGEGALLLSAEKIYRNKFGSDDEVKLYGCDIKPVNGLLEHLPSSHLNEIDFLTFSTNQKYDLILMNPPYVRHHSLEKENIPLYQQQIDKILNISAKSDLWMYFLIKSTSYLKQCGSIGAILPWSFLQADYANILRKWLLEIFGRIQVLTLTCEYFKDAGERVVLIWLMDFGISNKSLKIASTKHFNDKSNYINLTKDKWISKKVVYTGNIDASSIVTEYVNKYGFVKFEEIASVKIGIVTGADKYFIVPKEKVKDLTVDENNLIPILNTSRQLSMLNTNGVCNDNYLLYFDEDTAKRNTDYIMYGEGKEFHHRAHSFNRKPWYKVKTGIIPDAFFPYRISKYPILSINKMNGQCTNSIHRIYFKNLTETEIKWAQISLFSTIGQLSIEINSKTYGRGMLKVEPSSLNNSIVYICNDKSINSTYRKINKLLKNGFKSESVKLATKFINSNLNIPKKLSEITNIALREIQSRRLS